MGNLKGPHRAKLPAPAAARLRAVRYGAQASERRSGVARMPARSAGPQRPRARSEMGNLKGPHRAKLKLEAPPGFEPGMEVLQTSALPLGDGAGRTQLYEGVPAAIRRGNNSVT
jgi:hypothetical protein